MHRSIVHRAVCAAGIVAAVGTAGAAFGQCGDEPVLTASDKASNDYLGSSAAFQGNRIAMGATGDDNAQGLSAGAVYVFDRSNRVWSQAGKIVPADLEPLDYFGRSVDLDGDFVIAGAEGGLSANGYDAGNAYVYFKFLTGWLQGAKLNAGQAAGDDFGRSVAISGSTAVVGAPRNDNNIGVDAGAAHIFKFQSGNWVNTTAIKIGRAGDLLGSAVAMYGQTIVVGAPQWDYDGAFNDYTDAGRVYVYGPSGNAWELVDALEDTSMQNDARFGSSVDIDGEIVVAGAPGTDISGNADVGSITIFRKLPVGGYNLSLKVGPPNTDYVANARFGSSVVVSGDRIAVSAPGVDKVYMFRRTGLDVWEYDGAIEDANNDVGWGSSIAMSDDELLIGDNSADPDLVAQAGSARVYWINPDTGGTHPYAATPITLPASVTGCTEIATVSGIAIGCGSATNSRDVWYEFTAGKTGNVIADTTGSSFDTVVAAYSAEIADWLTPIGCNDDATPGVTTMSHLSFPVQGGKKYFVRVAGYSGASGAYALSVEADCPADMDGSGSVDVFDLLAYLDLWFSAAAGAEWPGTAAGVDVFDLLGYLDAWFAGC